MLLHGFPEYWASWQQCIEPVAEAGYRVWVPDQRGYNLSSKPQGIDCYALDELARDILGLMDAAERARAHIIGHDWGGTVAWWLAMHAPERVGLGVALARGPATSLALALVRHGEMAASSWTVVHRHRVKQ